MEEQTKIVTVDELMQMKPPKPRIEIGRDKLRNLRGTWLELAEHTEGKLCPICKVPVKQEYREGVHREIENGSYCPKCGMVFRTNRWVFGEFQRSALYQFNPRLDVYSSNNYFIDPHNKDIYIGITVVGESFQVWKDGVYGGGHHEWRVNRDWIAIPMTLEMVGCNGKELVASIYAMK